MKAVGIVVCGLWIGVNDTLFPSICHFSCGVKQMSDSQTTFDQVGRWDMLIAKSTIIGRENERLGEVRVRVGVRRDGTK